MYPEITFRMNLETLNRLSTVAPCDTKAQADNLKLTRIGVVNLMNIGGNVVENHDGTFTAFGEVAAYLKRTHVSTPASPQDLLVVV